MAKRKKADCFPFIQEMEGCNAGDKHDIPSDSDEMFETQVNYYMLKSIDV